MTQEVYFLRNGWECDFVAFPPGKEGWIIQVTARLDHANIDRELKGLAAGIKHLGRGQALLLADSREPGLQIPEWVRVVPVMDWLLE